MKNYAAPEISILITCENDILTTSLGGGFDSSDNWQNDVFPGLNRE